MIKSFVWFVVFMITSVCMVAQSRYELPCGLMLNRLSLEYARSQVGISDAKNPGQVREYLKTAGVGYYNPFCASGLYWCKVQGKKTLEFYNKMFGTQYDTKLPYPRSALANYPFNYAKKHGTKTAYTPQVTDYLVWYISGTPNGHIEVVDSLGSAGWLSCIGFNTGNREVKRTKRNIYHPLGRRLVRGLVGFKQYDN